MSGRTMYVRTRSNGYYAALPCGDSMTRKWHNEPEEQRIIFSGFLVFWLAEMSRGRGRWGNLFFDATPSKDGLRIFPISVRGEAAPAENVALHSALDRKSTRLNSSHLG